MSKKSTLQLKHLTLLAAYLLVVWGFYRFLFKLPEEVEEIFVKPILWLVPVIYFVRKEGLGIGSLGITFKNFFPAVYLSLGLGIFFAIEGVLVNILKYGQVEFQANVGSAPFALALSLSFLTAISEEITFRGYFFNRLWQITQNEWRANLITSLVWALIHIPISIFWWQLDFQGVIVYLLLTMLFGIGSAFVFAKTKNVFSSILLHVFWSWPIILFR